MTSSCLPPSTLRRYLCGEFSESSAQLEEHLAGCQMCLALLERLAEESDSKDQALQQVMLKARSDQGFAISDDTPAEQASANETKLSSIPGDQPSRLAGHSDMESIRDYRLLEVIGQGGMGTVYRALNTGLNMLVAVKILNPDLMGSEQAISRFKREMHIVGQLKHPQIVRALDAGEHESKPYLVMEYVHGIDLGQLLKRLGPLPVADVCEAIRLAALALDFAHDSKILHRDIKPSNLMLTTDGDLKVLDLGLAQVVDRGDHSTSTGNWAVGTFAYMAPEILLGGAAASKQTEVFSLGVTLFQLLTGIRPYERADMPAVLSNLTHVRPDVPGKLAAAVERMIARNPAERPADMQQVGDLLAPFASGANLHSLIQEYYRWSNRGEPPKSSHIHISSPIPTQEPRSASNALVPRQRLEILATNSLIFLAFTATALVLASLWLVWGYGVGDRRPPEVNREAIPTKEVTPEPQWGIVKARW